MASSSSTPIKLDKVCKVFLEAFTGRAKWTPSWKISAVSKWQISWAGACSSKLASIFSGSGGLGPEPLLVYVSFIGKAGGKKSKSLEGVWHVELPVPLLDQRYFRKGLVKSLDGLFYCW